MMILVSDPREFVFQAALGLLLSADSKRQWNPCVLWSFDRSPRDQECCTDNLQSVRYDITVTHQPCLPSLPAYDEPANTTANGWPKWPKTVRCLFRPAGAIAARQAGQAAHRPNHFAYSTVIWTFKSEIF